MIDIQQHHHFHCNQHLHHLDTSPPGWLVLQTRADACKKQTSPSDHRFHYDTMQYLTIPYNTIPWMYNCTDISFRPSLPLRHHSVQATPYLDLVTCKNTPKNPMTDTSLNPSLLLQHKAILHNTTQYKYNTTQGSPGLRNCRSNQTSSE